MTRDNEVLGALVYGRHRATVTGAIAPHLTLSPQRVGAKGQSDCAPDILLFGKGQRVDVLYPDSRRKKNHVGR